MNASPNGDTTNYSYDAYARVDEVVSPHGAVTEYVYQNSPPKKRAITRFQDHAGN